VCSAHDNKYVQQASEAFWIAGHDYRFDRYAAAPFADSTRMTGRTRQAVDAGAGWTSSRQQVSSPLSIGQNSDGVKLSNNILIAMTWGKIGIDMNTQTA